jgi:hypothetical protein
VLWLIRPGSHGRPVWPLGRLPVRALVEGLGSEPASGLLGSRLGLGLPGGELVLLGDELGLGLPGSGLGLGLGLLGGELVLLGDGLGLRLLGDGLGLVLLGRGLGLGLVGDGLRSLAGSGLLAV